LPELPEIEHLKRSLEPFLIGSTVVKVDLQRRDVLRQYGRQTNWRAYSKDLLAGTTISSLCRHGKNLALVSDAGPVLCVHLGMSGQMRFSPAGKRLSETTHVHCLWTLASKQGNGKLIFRDPRRFGGLWSFPSIQMLREHRWSSLGPDALAIRASDLAARLHKTQRPIKAALLEQSILAGVGNIYADESLFRAGIDPRSIAARLSKDRVKALTRAIHQVLGAAINAGGSTIRSYLDGSGNGGSFANRHQVYGRGGQVCLACGHSLEQVVIAQRTTVFCNHCQQLFL